MESKNRFAVDRGRTPGRPPGADQATAGFSATVGRGDLVEALAQVGDDGGDSYALSRWDALTRYI
jgi:hypothetical protein